MLLPFTLRRHHYVLLFFASSWLLYSCQTAAVGRVPPDFAVTLHRSTCAGSCPAYTVQVDDMGKVTLQGIAYTNYVGTWQKQLPPDQLAKLSRTLRRSAFFSYDTLYNAPQVPALPWLEMTYVADEEAHRVRFRTHGPESFRKLAAKVETIIGLNEGFTPAGVTAFAAPDAQP